MLNKKILKMKERSFIEDKKRMRNALVIMNHDKYMDFMYSESSYLCEDSPNWYIVLKSIDEPSPGAHKSCILLKWSREFGRFVGEQKGIEGLVADIAICRNGQIAKVVVITLYTVGDQRCSVYIYSTSIRPDGMNLFCKSVSLQIKEKIREKDDLSMGIHPIYQIDREKTPDKVSLTFYQKNHIDFFYLRLKSYQDTYTNLLLNIKKKSVSRIDDRMLVDNLRFTADRFGRYVFAVYYQARKLKIARYIFNNDKVRIDYIDGYETVINKVDVNDYYILPRLRDLSISGRCMAVEIKQQKNLEILKTVLFEE